MRFSSVTRFATGRLSTEGESPPYRHYILTYLGIGAVSDTLITLSLGFLLPGMSEDLSLSPSQQGWLGSSFLLGAMAFALPTSLWLSRFSAKHVFSVSLLLGAMLVLVQGWSPVFAVLIAGRIGFGLVTVARQPARAMLTTQWFPTREIVFVNGIINGTYGVAGLIGLLGTPYLLLLLDDSWRATLTVFAVVYIATGVVWIYTGKERQGKHPSLMSAPSGPSPLRSVLKYPNLWYASLGMFGVDVAWSGFITFWPTLALEDHDISLTTSGAILTLAAVIEAVGSVVATVYLSRSNRKGIRGPLVAVLAVMLAGGASGMALTGSIPLLIVLASVHGIGFSLAPIALTVPFELEGATRREVAVGVGFMETMLRAGGAAGPLMVGFLQEATGSLEKALFITCLCGLVMVASAFLIYGGGSEQSGLPPIEEARS